MVMFLIEGINYAQFFSRIVNALPEQKQKDAIFVSGIGRSANS